MKNHAAEQILYYRVFVSLLLVWLVMLSIRKKDAKNSLETFRRLDRKTRIKTIGLCIGAAVFVTLNWLIFIYVINHVSLQSGVFAYLVCPIITALLGFLLLKERLNRLKLAAIGMAFVSIIFMATGSLTEVLWSVAIAVTYAGYLIVQRVLLYIDKFSMLGIQLGISTVFLLPFYIAHFEALPSGASFWYNTVALSVLFTIIPLFLSMYALTGIPSSTVGITIYINPIIAFGVAVIYFHEPVDEHKFGGYMLLFMAVILFNWNIISEALFRRRKVNLHPDL